MKELIIEDIPAQPDDIILFPDFIFAAMARRGFGSVEVESSCSDSPRQPPTSWTFRHDVTETVDTIAETRPFYFRSILARFATLCGINPYGGEMAVSIAAPSLGTHQFFVALKNSQQSGFGIRIHLRRSSDLN